MSKAVLHHAIFRAICVATAKSALLQLHKQRCCNGDEVKVEGVFLFADRTNIARQEGRYTVQCFKNPLQRCRNRCEK